MFVSGDTKLINKWSVDLSQARQGKGCRDISDRFKGVLNFQ